MRTPGSPPAWTTPKIPTREEQIETHYDSVIFRRAACAAVGFSLLSSQQGASADPAATLIDGEETTLEEMDEEMDGEKDHTQ